MLINDLRTEVCTVMQACADAEQITLAVLERFFQHPAELEDACERVEDWIVMTHEAGLISEEDRKRLLVCPWTLRAWFIALREPMRNLANAEARQLSEWRQIAAIDADWANV